MAEGGKTEEFDDEQLEELFSAFDELSASDSLKAGALAAIAGLSAAGAGAVGAGAPAAGTVAEGAGAAGSPAGSSAPAAGAPKASAVRGGRPRVKGRGFRATAVAASLALVVTGGVAYATPTSIVTVAQGDSAIELGVNFFGTSVSASSDDEVGRAALASGNLVHVPYGDALSRAANALDAAGASGSLELFVESADEGQRERLAGQNQVFLADRGEPGEPGSDGDAVAGTADGGQLGGDSADRGAGASDGSSPADGAPAAAAAAGSEAAGPAAGDSWLAGQPYASSGYGSDSRAGTGSSGGSSGGSSAGSSAGEGRQASPGGDDAGAVAGGVSWTAVKEPSGDQVDPGGPDGGEELARRVPESNGADGFDCHNPPSWCLSYFDSLSTGGWTWTGGSGWWVGPTSPGWTWGDGVVGGPDDADGQDDTGDLG